MEATVDPFEPPMPARTGAKQRLTWRSLSLAVSRTQARLPRPYSGTSSRKLSHEWNGIGRRGPCSGRSSPISPQYRTRDCGSRFGFGLSDPDRFPESDGTIEWDSTTLVVVEITAADTTGLGYTYADKATATLIRDHLAKVIRGRDATGISAIWEAMVRSIRNLGRPGIVSMAISAVDVALWDLKGKRLGVPVVTLLGAAQECAPIYGSGGFTFLFSRPAP